ncbi:MAG TPA: carbonic anhydrase family protein [Blastocatellia bacterium]|jgi:carbonic anhydrase|nr:carbonic anhydrase family protein [Blastocatellia bacterium]
MKRLPINLLLVFAVFSIAFSTSLQQTGSQGAHQATAGSECKEWSYYGADGPGHWAKLFPHDCGSQHQSPVDIVNSTPRDLPAIGLSYGSSKLTVNREHFAPQVNYDPGSSINYAGTTYDLKQFHFHLPGEHRISNAGYVMEMHLVHKTSDGQNTAVIGVLFKVQGAANPAFKSIIDNLPPPDSEHGGTGPEINAQKLLPANRSYYKYSGSLTVPCCTEPVLWLVLADPVRISGEQLRKFQYSQGGKRNNRPVQRRIRADR